MQYNPSYGRGNTKWVIFPRRVLTERSISRGGASWRRTAKQRVRGRVRGRVRKSATFLVSTWGDAGGRGGACYGVWLGVSVDPK